MRPERKHKRVIKRLEIEFSSKGSTFRSISGDLSRDGIFVRTSRPFAVSTELELMLHLPDNIVSRLMGRVRWAVKKATSSSKSGMGIEIIGRDRLFDDYLDSLGVAPGERVRDNGHTATVPVSVSMGRAPAPRAESLPVNLPKLRQDAEDEAIDSLIAGMFSKKGKK
jgi:Tfp pilus assembly protein PilZ